MRACARAVLLWMLLALPAACASFGQSPQNRPAIIEVRLPGDAGLEVNGCKMLATGETCRCQSPPLEVGQSYTYPVQASWKDKTVSRVVTVHAGGLSVVDLNAELRAGVPAGEKFTLQVPPVLAVEAGGSALFAIHVKRTNYHGPIALSFADLPANVTISPVAIISAGQATWRGTVKAGSGTKLNTTSVTVRAQGGAVSPEAVFDLIVSEPSAFTAAPAPPRSTVLKKPVQPAGGKRVAVLEVHLPADAELELDGNKTKLTGEVRRFESPPVQPGKTFAYGLRATWHSKAITRTVAFRPESPTVVDLRPDFTAEESAGRKGVIPIALTSESSTPPSGTPALGSLSLSLEVRLPADAELKVNGKAVPGSGEERRFRTAPVMELRPVDYLVAVSWRGRMVTRTIKLHPGRPAMVDFRDDFLEAAADSFRLEARPVTVAAGAEERFVLNIVRRESPRRADRVCRRRCPCWPEDRPPGSSGSRPERLPGARHRCAGSGAGHISGSHSGPIGENPPRDRLARHGSGPGNAGFGTDPFRFGWADFAACP